MSHTIIYVGLIAVSNNVMCFHEFIQFGCLLFIMVIILPAIWI